MILDEVGGIAHQRAAKPAGFLEPWHLLVVKKLSHHHPMNYMGMERQQLLWAEKTSNLRQHQLSLVMIKVIYELGILLC